jgi:malate dehydrogenase (oxaloacetate-decarboxylating)(NADP+)
MLLCDTKGVLHEGRRGSLTPEKTEFLRDTKARTLADAVRNADVFVGVSQAGLLTAEMVKSMARSPVIFAMANPDPEITPSVVRQVCSDAIVATGRSDFPNQVNNVLGFPFIFRGALDVRASRINEAMKLAAVHALAELARRGEGVPQAVRTAYPRDVFDFGRDYILPKPFDPRILTFVAPAVAQAAMDSGVARRKIDGVEYTQRLEQTVGVLANL